MKIREIKTDMVIHCKTKEEAEELFKFLGFEGYRWADGDCLSRYNTRFERYKKSGNGICYIVNKFKRITHDSPNFIIDNGYKFVEFTDLEIKEEHFKDIHDEKYACGMRDAWELALILQKLDKEEKLGCFNLNSENGKQWIEIMERYSPAQVMVMLNLRENELELE